MKPVVALPAATAELAQAVAWYEEREPGLGERFYVAFQEARLFIRRYSAAGSPFAHGARKWRVPGFPFKVIYPDFTEEILIIAIAHHSRRPGYWQQRLRE